MAFSVVQLQLHFNYLSRVTQREYQPHLTGGLPGLLTQIYWLVLFDLNADWLLRMIDWNFVVACGTTFQTAR